MRDYNGNEMVIRKTNNGKFQVLKMEHTARELSSAQCFETEELAKAYIDRPMPSWINDERQKDIERLKHNNTYSGILSNPDLREMRRDIQEAYQRASWESKLAGDAQRATVREIGKISVMGRDIGELRQGDADNQADDASVAWSRWSELCGQYEMELQSRMIEAGIPVELFRSPVMDSDRLNCLRCGHGWRSKKNIEPKFCPKCNSPYWNKSREVK